MDRWIGSFSRIPKQQWVDVGRIHQRSLQTEGMRTFQVAAEYRSRLHRSRQRNRSERDSLTGRHSTVMTTQAQLAWTIQCGLDACLVVCGARIKIVSLYRELLIPQRSRVRKSSMGSVAIEARIRERTLHLPRSGRCQIMRSQLIAAKLGLCADR